MKKFMFLDELKAAGKKEGKAEEKIAILKKLEDDEKIGYTKEELTQILEIEEEKEPEEKQHPPIDEILKKFDELPFTMKGKPLKQYTGKRKKPSLIDKQKAEGKEEGKIEEKIAIINKLIDDPKIEYSPEELSKKIWDEE